jgi:ATP-dependent exoDNAse (exonuclease V) alpha subunit
MVSDELLTFISNMFGRIHSSHLPFDGRNVILVGDLGQLPPVQGNQVFYSATWQLFYPLFRTTSHRQGEDTVFFEVLQKIRMGQIDGDVWNALNEKFVLCRQRPHDVLSTTHIIGLRATAKDRNDTISAHLPEPDNDEIFSLTISSVDYVEGELWHPSLSERMFRSHTNLPSELYFRIGARVMFLNNTLFDNGLCNGSIGVITAINQFPNDSDELSVQVAFPVKNQMVEVEIHRITDHFQCEGKNCSRKQYPLQLAFALTVHKTQGLTLPSISVQLDHEMFALAKLMSLLVVLQPGPP